MKNNELTDAPQTGPAADDQGGPASSEPPNRGEFEQVKLLFEYTKFHLGAYMTAAAALVALINTDFGKRICLPEPLVWAAVLFIAIAGVAGGIVASSLPHSSTLEKFWARKVGPFRLELFTGETWTYVEHSAFWLAIVCVLAAFALRNAAPSGAG